MKYNYGDLPKSEIEVNSKRKVKTNRVQSLLDATADLDDYGTDDCVLASDLLAKAEKKKVERNQSAIKQEDDDFQYYLNGMNSMQDEAVDFSFGVKSAKKKKKKKNKRFNDLFDYDDDDEGDGDKKKKKKDGQPINHKKEFEPELALLRDMQLQQAKFVDSLQKKYDQLESSNSSARGIRKFTTDLINSISTARGTSLQIVDKIISTKRSIADMNFKERKEFGSNNTSEQANMVNYASTYLKTMMEMGRNNIAPADSSTTQDYADVSSDDDLFDGIEDSLGEESRDEETLKYLEYENRGVKINVVWHDDLPEDDPDKYEFQAVDKDGVVIDDYPLPEHTRMNINRSTSTATDLYGNKYRLIVV